MGTFKKLIKYIILFTLFFLFVGVMKEIPFNNKEKNEEYMMNYNVKVDSPLILVEKSRTTNKGGYINGYILNNTEEHIKDKYMQFDFYDEDGRYLGTQTKEIKYFNVKEKINFDIQYNYEDVGRIDIDFVDEINEMENKDMQKKLNTNESFLRINPSNDKTVKTIGTTIGAFLLAGTATILLIP